MISISDDSSNSGEISDSSDRSYSSFDGPTTWLPAISQLPGSLELFLAITNLASLSTSSPDHRLVFADAYHLRSARVRASWKRFQRLVILIKVFLPPIDTSAGAAPPGQRVRRSLRGGDSASLDAADSWRRIRAQHHALDQLAMSRIRDIPRTSRRSARSDSELDW